MAYCHMVFGAPGTGKTTYAVAMARKAIKKKWKVFTNFPCEDAFRVDSNMIGKLQIRDALVLIDEAGIDFNNRNWKSLPTEFIEYMKLHRHYGTSFVFFSQGWDDCDKKIRTLCTKYYNLKKLGPLTVCRELRKRVGIDEATKQIIDEYFKVPFVIKGISFCWRPRWYRFFDSWDAPVLTDYPAVPWSAPKDEDSL